MSIRSMMLCLIVLAFSLAACGGKSKMIYPNPAAMSPNYILNGATYFVSPQLTNGEIRIERSHYEQRSAMTDECDPQGGECKLVIEKTVTLKLNAEGQEKAAFVAPRDGDPVPASPAVEAIGREIAKSYLAKRTVPLEMLQRSLN